jgi:hypothetical protein
VESVHVVGFGHDRRLDVSFGHGCFWRMGVSLSGGGAKELGFGALEFRDDDSTRASPA